MSKTLEMIDSAEGLLAFYGDGQVALCYKNPADIGQLIFKNVSVNSIRRAFSGQELDSGWLSPGLMRWGVDTTGEWWVRYSPPALYSLELDGGETVTVPLPGMVMFAHGAGYYVCALKTEFNPNAQLFQTPLPNCWADGRVCWGQNAILETKLSNADLAWNLFINSPFNRDLANQKSRKHKSNS